VIDIKQLREAPDRVRQALGRRRRADLDKRLDDILRDDQDWRRLVQHTEKLKADLNKASAEVARLKRAKEDAGPAMTGLKDLSDSIKAGDAELREYEARIQDQLLQIPNVPLPDVPDGDAASNKIVGEWGKPTKLSFNAKPHWELGASLGILDLERGAKVSGSGFPMFIGSGAKLVRALITFMLDIHTTEHGYVEIAPPLLVNRASAQGTGQLPDLENNMYVTEDGLYLVPTAEVPVTNVHRDEVLAAAELPKTYCAYTPCFRREAGAAGKDTRGILRVHQFDKVEIVRLCRPDDSPAEHETILRHAQVILERLELPYRTVALSTGDMGFSSAKTYDLEAWAAGVGAWLEVSSASTFTDFQARRANIRYRPRPDAKPEFVHTLNASGVALPRTLIALLENNQQADGSVRIPKALVPYFGRDRITPQAS